MKIALVYDRINKIGGAERILMALQDIFPEAPIYTLVYDPKRATWAKQAKIETSFLQSIPFARQFHEFFPVLPIFAFELFNFSEYDLVISVTATEAKGIITSPNTLHLSYLLTPTRYLWSHYWQYFKKEWLRWFSLPIISILRIWDQFAAMRPDEMVAISDCVAKRTEKYYRRKVDVLYPPVDIEKFTINKRINRFEKNRNYFLVVSRLVYYKRIDIAIEACNRLNLQLKIIGVGLDKGRLEKLASTNVEFLGNLTEDKLCHYYQNCRALLFPGEEDLGLTSIEALACGRPVVAFGKGGICEVVSPGITGEFFYEQTSEALTKILDKFNENAYKEDLCRKAALKFDRKFFKRNLLKRINKLWARFEKEHKFI